MAALTDRGQASANTSKAERDVDFSRPVVFYDGGCPLCRREINHYRRLDRKKRLAWIDISREPMRVRSYGLKVEQAMLSFHVLDGTGCWKTGAEAFVVLWSQLPYYRHVASAIRKLRLSGLLDIAYKRWAVWRFRRRCEGNRCGVSHE